MQTASVTKVRREQRFWPGGLVEEQGTVLLITFLSVTAEAVRETEEEGPEERCEVLL